MRFAQVVLPKSKNMKKQIFTFILTLITAFGVIAQTDSQDTQAQEINKMNLEVVRLFSEKKYSEALPIAKRTIELTEKKYGGESIELARTYFNLGYLFTALNDDKSAKNTFEKAVKIYKKIPNLSKKDGEQFAQILENLAINKQKKDFIFAESDLEEAVLWREKFSGSDAKELTSTYFLLGNISYWKKDYKKSAERYFKVLDLIEKNASIGKDNANMAYYRCRCSYFKAGKDSEIYDLERKFKDKILPQMPPDLKSINSGVVNGKALDLVKPPYPSEARTDRAEGTVPVEVFISKEGKVVSACGLGKVHKALIEAA